VLITEVSTAAAATLLKTEGMPSGLPPVAKQRKRRLGIHTKRSSAVASDSKPRPVVDPFSDGTALVPALRAAIASSGESESETMRIVSDICC
jgi:hypothetical protein